MTVAAATAAYETARAAFERAQADLRAAIDADALALLGVAISDPTVREVVRAVSEATGIPVASIVGDSREQHIADARIMAMALSREAVTSPPAILATFFRRDRTSIHYAERTMAAHEKCEPAYAARIARLRAILGIPAPRGSASA